MSEERTRNERGPFSAGTLPSADGSLPAVPTPPAVDVVSAGAIPPAIATSSAISTAPVNAFGHLGGAPAIAATTLPAAENVPVAEGTILAGKYRVERVLGMGGMGVVVAAMHVQLDQRVALKFLLPDAIQNAEVVARFAREARAAVRIQSEHVARVIDVGQLDNGLPYMVMEYLHGRDLAATLRERGPLPIDEALDFLLQACEAIAQAHAIGIVHRDLKPANLFLTTRPDGTPIVKVLDFGISKVSLGSGSAADMSLTKTTAVMGSPTYMSPEQMRASRDVDARSDIWALGVILYELLTGRAPFSGETMPALCAAILTEAPTSPRALRREIPAGVDSTILRCLEKNPGARFANVAEFSAALVAFAPKRSRLSAERSARILRGAGIDTASLPPLASNPPRIDPQPVAGSTAAAWSQAEVTGDRVKAPEPKGAARWKLGAVGGLLAIGALVALKLHAGSTDSALAASAHVLATPASPMVAPSAEPAPLPSPVATATIESVNTAPATTTSAAPRTASQAPKPRATKAVAAPTPPPKPSPEPQPPPTPTKKSPLQIDIK